MGRRLSSLHEGGESLMATRGKYSHVIDKLPRLGMVEPERRDLVEAVKAEILAPPDDGENLPWVLDLDRALDMIETHVRELLRLVKRSTAGRPRAAEFARAYADCRDMAARIGEWESSLNLLTEAFQQLMVDQMEVEGVTSMKLVSGRPVSTYLEPYAQVTDKETFRLWCVAQGLERQMALPWGTANALTKARLLEGEPEPDGVTCYAKTKVRLGGK
ncbi:MAG: hypothetical protein NUV51_04515 [Sulfuricaulis sp.]|nr:hypothetical protein [Sulfuricaulis sp.]